MRKTLSDKGVAALKPRATRYAFPDPELRGHYVRVQPSGAKTFAAVAVDPEGRQIWTSIGRADAMAIDEARAKARNALARVRAGLPAFEAPAAKRDSFKEVAESWLTRHVVKNGLRSKREITRLLSSHIHPAWKDRDFLSIRRSDVAMLLDRVEDNHSARQADYVLSVVRSVMNWYAARNDDYVPPIVRGMRRQSPTAQARVRTLDDDEIRLIWHAAEGAGKFGAIVRMCLLTAQRRTKVETIRWCDISDAGEWSVPTEAREKGTGGLLALPNSAIAILRAQAQIGDNPFVFAGRGNGPFQGTGYAKARFDAALPSLAPWVIHDLRRTARSLMSRAGVRPDIAERVLGHVIGGVEGVYDRHSYFDEKADALRKLAALIESIVNPQENVVPLRGTK